MQTNLVDGHTRCLFVRPSFLENTFYNLTEVFRTLGARSPAPPLGALVAASYVPPHWECRLVDEDVTPLTDDDLRWADIVMLSGIGPQEDTLIKAARRAKAFGKPVVVGGAGPTLQPDVYTALDCFDYVVVGEAELTLPKLFEDLKKGVSRGVYKPDGLADVSDAPVPRYDLLKDTHQHYLFIGMSYTRGCPFNCEFCAQVKIFGKKSRTKSVAQVLREHRALHAIGYRGMVDFGYDNLIGHPKKTEEVLTAMAKWNADHGHPFCYSTEATMNLARMPRMLELMRANDFRYLFIGIESGDSEVLDKASKGQNTRMPPDEAVKVINAYGMVVNTGVIVGFDGETSESVGRTLEMVQKTGAFPSLVLPLHALPGTDLAARLATEGRLFDGAIDIDREDRTDTATTGLNFVTSRSRVAIMKDLVKVLETAYRPSVHYERTARTMRQLRLSRKFQPSWLKMLQLTGAFYKIATTLGVDRETAPHFWSTLGRALLTDPALIEPVIGGAVFAWNYAKQARTYTEAIREQIAEVEREGEEVFNLRRLSHHVPPVECTASAN